MKIPYQLAKIIGLRFFCIGKKIEDAHTHFLLFITKWIREDRVVEEDEWPNSIAYPDLATGYQYISQLKDLGEITVDQVKNIVLEMYMLSKNLRKNTETTLVVSLPEFAEQGASLFQAHYDLDEGTLIAFDKLWQKTEELLLLKKRK